MRVVAVCIWLLCSSALCAVSAAERIVVLAPNLVELLFSIDAGDQIIGTVEFADYPQQAQQIPRLGNFQGVQLEKLYALKPSLVLYWRSGTKAQDIASIEQLGIKTIGFEPQQPADIVTVLRQLGELTGHQEQAEPLARQTQQRLDALSLYRQKPAIAVFYEIWHEPLTTIGKSDWPAQALALCGAYNTPVLSTAYPQVSVEALIASPPAAIILPSSVNEPRQHFAYQQWPALNKLPQLQVNADVLHRATLRTIAGIEQLCLSIDELRK